VTATHPGRTRAHAKMVDAACLRDATGG